MFFEISFTSECELQRHPDKILDAYVDIQRIVVNRIDEIGYKQGLGFDLGKA